MLPALLFFLVGAYLTYWVVRLAVTHGMRDALRNDLLDRAGLDDVPQASAQSRNS